MDYKILEFIRLHFKCSFLDKFMKHFSTLFNYSIIWMILGVGLFFFKSTRQFGFEIFFALTLELLVCNAIVKRFTKRERPFRRNEEVNLLINPPKDYSFPSGHTLCAFLAATIMIYFNLWIGIALFLVAFIIAFSRVYLYVHFPSDVLAGAILGVCIALISHVCTERMINLGWLEL